MIFDTISVKARWEQWCRWNYDLRVINARNKGIFCRTESIAMTPKSHDHMPTTSLWAVAAKWPTQAPKTKLILCPRDPQGYCHISLSLSGRILKEYRGLRNRTHWSARYTNGLDSAQQEKSARLNCINLIHFLLTAGRLRWSSCIVIPGVVCELLQFAVHTVGRHR